MLRIVCCASVGLAAWTLTGGLLVARQARPPTILDREVAAVGLANRFENVREADIAVSGDRAMVTFIQDVLGIGYAYFDGSSWTEGTVTTAAVDDPSVASGRLQIRGTPTDGFICCYRSPAGVWVRTFDPAQPAAGFGQSAVRVRTPSAVSDKSWILAGARTGSYHELQVVWFEGFSADNVWFASSPDGGLSWTGQHSIRDRASGIPLWTRFGPQPARTGAARPGALFLGYIHGPSGFLRILEGFQTGAGTPSGWEFEHLRDGAGDELTVGLFDTTHDSDENEVPGRFIVLRVPYLVADPTDPDRLFLVFHDQAAPDSADLDVFCVTITRSGSVWSCGPRVRVNDDPPAQGPGSSSPVDDHDQCIPAAAVDGKGRVHIAFYDDRWYDQPDSELNARFEVTYAVSTDHGRSFSNYRLQADSDEPALNCAWTDNSIGHHVPGEYPGIACEGDTVWIAYAGTWSGDRGAPSQPGRPAPMPDRSVIYVTRIVH